MEIYLFKIAVIDGTGKELESKLVCLGQRKSGVIIEIGLNYFFNYIFIAMEGCFLDMADKNKVQFHALKFSESLKDEIFSRRERQLQKIADFLDKTFSQQYINTVKNYVDTSLTIKITKIWHL